MARNERTVHVRFIDFTPPNEWTDLTFGRGSLTVDTILAALRAVFKLPADTPIELTRQSFDAPFRKGDFAITEFYSRLYARLPLRIQRFMAAIKTFNNQPSAESEQALQEEIRVFLDVPKPLQQLNETEQVALRTKIEQHCPVFDVELLSRAGLLLQLSV